MRTSLVVALIVLAVGAEAAAAQEPSQVTGLGVRQADGFATLSWNPVAGATDYQIERTPVGADDLPTGPAAIVGVWRPNRTVTPDAPTFADAGFNPGDRFQWRVRARHRHGRAAVLGAGVRHDACRRSATRPCRARTCAPQWEQTQAAQFTSDVNEYDYTAALDAASDRVRVVEIGRTVLGPPDQHVRHRLPDAAAPRAQAIANSPAALVNCNVHGNEPSSREACLIMARELAFARRPAHARRSSSNTTVLIVPSINGDGRAANTRGNSTGQDLNRDYSLIREPETFAFVEMLRDYTPEAGFDGHEFGNSQAGDLPMLPPRHLNVAQSIFDESRRHDRGLDVRQRLGRRLVVLPVRMPERRRGRPQPGDDPAQHDGAQERDRLAAGGAQRGRRDPAGRDQRAEQPPPQDLLGALHLPAVPRLPAGEPARRSQRAIERVRSRSRRSNTRPDRVPRLAPDPGVPGAASGREPAAGGAAGGDPRPAAVRLPAHDAQYSGPQADGPPVGERLRAHGIKVVRLTRGRQGLRADEAAAARADPAAARRRGRGADGGGGADAAASAARRRRRGCCALSTA